MAPALAAQPKLPSVQSRETRVALLSMYDQVGMGLDPGSEPTRSRANRRHPDVGFISSDPICLSCVMTVLAPPASIPPPAPIPSLQPVASNPAPILPVAPQPAPILPEAPNPVSIVASPLPVENAPQSLPEESFPEVLLTQTITQTPGPLPILGFGATLGVSRRLRGRLKAAKSQHKR